MIIQKVTASLEVMIMNHLHMFLISQDTIETPFEGADTKILHIEDVNLRFCGNNQKLELSFSSKVRSNGQGASPWLS